MQKITNPLEPQESTIIKENAGGTSGARFLFLDPRELLEPRELQKNGAQNTQKGLKLFSFYSLSYLNIIKICNTQRRDQ